MAKSTQKDISTSELQAELDQLLQWFNSDNVDLDEAVAKYARGTELVAELQKRLAAAENVIKKLPAL